MVGVLVACLLVLAAAAPTAAAASSTAKTPIVLSGHGLGVVYFGSSARSVTKAVSARLGAPTGHPDGGCVGGYTEVAWHDLIVQFRHGHFSGYRYWVSGSGSLSASASAVSPKLATAKGISLGSTFAQVKRSYRLTQTGTDFWKSHDGIVFALDSQIYPSPPSSPVHEIKSYGMCPAAL
jgi:hypothetical protein